jgi:hypothetical protein
MRYLEYRQLQGLKKIRYRQRDALFGLNAPIFYLNRFIYIKGKTLRDKLFFKLLYLMKLNRYSAIDIFYLVLGLHYLNIKTVHIRVAGRSHYIPVPMSINEGHSMLIRFLMKGSKSQTETTYERRLLQEFEAILYSTNKSYTLQYIDKVYDQAKEDRIFAHFRWR